MSFLRDRMGLILVIVIGLALFAFIAGEVITYGKSFMNGDRNAVGEVAGETLGYDEYQKRIAAATQNFMQQSGQSTLTPQFTTYIQENAWNQYISQSILNREMERLGISVGEAEINAIVHTPDQQLMQAFGDPKTGKLDDARFNQFLSRVSTAKKDDPTLQQWNAYITPKIEQRRAEKYISLVQNGLFANDLDAKDDYLAKNKLVNFKYIALNYSSLPDSKIEVSSSDYQEYFDAHKGMFKNQQELRSFEYVAFNGAASKSDTTALKTQMGQLSARFKTDTNDSLFVQINAETKTPAVYQKKGQLDPMLDSVMFTATKGFVYGPYVSNGSYKIAKLIDERVGPDSVKARHILINPTTTGGVDKARAKADSLETLIKGGKSFADLAKTYSEDKASGEKGGELGTFGRGAMVPVFEDAVFNGAKGEYKIVTSQFGVHLIQIEDQKGSSKVVKVAVVDKPITPGNATQSAAYNKAQSFIAGVNSDNFDQIAKKGGYAIKKAADVTGTAAAVPGLDNARDLIRWAFNKAGKGDVSDQVYPVGDQYVVARLTAIKPQGESKLEDVKEQIKPEVIKMLKGKQLAAKLQTALNGASSIEQAAQKAGVQVTPVQNVVSANPVIPGTGIEYKVIGTAFGSALNKLSKPVAGDYGVYAFTVESFTNPAPLTNTVREREQLQGAFVQRTGSQAFEALKDKANVKDYRAKFL
ncbi:peptidylprolyl isomerase [Mucilaginibacter sp.]